MSNNTNNTTDTIDECPSILNVLGFLKFPDIKPISLSDTESDIKAKTDTLSNTSVYEEKTDT